MSSNLSVLLQPNSAINSVAFSPDGKLLATGSNDSATKLWRVADGMCTVALAGHTGAVNSVAFSPDGTLLATGSEDNTMKLWRVADGVCTATLAGHSATVRCVAFSPDGTMLATGGEDKTIKLWRVADGAFTATLAGHNDFVMSVAFSPDGTLLATGSEDKTIKLCRVADGVCIATLAGHIAAVAFVVFNADGTMFASVGADGLWLVWNVNSNMPLCSKKLLDVNVDDVVFVKCDSQCCVLEYCCDRNPTKLRAEFQWTTQKNDDTNPNASVPFFPHVFLEDVAVGSVIAGGSSCVLYNCTWRGRNYALKRYYPYVIRQIAREIAIAPYLQHPNIVRVVAIVDSSDGDAQTVGLLMELTSDSLAVVLASPSRPPQATILRWLHEAAQGIEYAHQCRVVHSDIKPENIMTVVNEQQHGGQSDGLRFGEHFIHSWHFNSTWNADVHCAPEYAAGDTGPTKASDVFSFGMTMWCALVPPGTDHGLGRIDLQVCRALDKGRRPPVAALDPLHAHLIERCWAEEPSQRPSMIEVEEALRNLVGTSAQPRSSPSSQLWTTLLQSYRMESALAALQYRPVGRIFFSDDIVDTTNPCYRFVAGMAGSLSTKVRRVVMVGVDTQTVISFDTLHATELDSRSVNPALSEKNPTDAASVAGLNRLMQSFIPVDTAPGEPLPSARLLFAWHGTKPDKIAAVCRDGPRSLRTTDCGYFGAGSYFALEAAYALRYSRPEPATGACAVILYLISVSQVRVITPERDYRRVEDDNTPHLHGFSRYYLGNRDTNMALAPGCDAHFIPVKECGCVHPLTGHVIPRNVQYQAVDESSGEAEAHEIVIGSHHRCIPIAIVYFGMEEI
ncbi:WD40 repeat-containing protein, putative [Bodo saltans]|uniref:WD40 repeat-containing protein, putative n=1 Tax=Bodo saltans TaxID=75058 RepID=A0A0S4JDZ2_BODSA|nr:WD40 repeat-containing protein, putative [Bodo saltans]|eukprot:CUG87646.1 WD40 repeat-containing protein, putative [Bodo saltans]